MFVLEKHNSQTEERNRVVCGNCFVYIQHCRLVDQTYSYEKKEGQSRTLKVISIQGKGSHTNTCSSQLL